MLFLYWKTFSISFYCLIIYEESRTKHSVEWSNAKRYDFVAHKKKAGKAKRKEIKDDESETESFSPPFIHRGSGNEFACNERWGIRVLF